MSSETFDPDDLEDPVLAELARETMKIVIARLSHLRFTKRTVWMYDIDTEEDDVAGLITFDDKYCEIWFSLFSKLATPLLRGAKSNETTTKLDYADPNSFGPDEVCRTILELEKYARQHQHKGDGLFRGIRAEALKTSKRLLFADDAQSPPKSRCRGGRTKQ
jgi:hypothetical protein